MDAWRVAVIEEAKTWLRTPWVHRARIKGAGVDCAQFLIGVYSGAGVVEAFDPPEYPPDWMLHKSEEIFLAILEQYMEQTSTPLPGDVAIWKYGHCFSHAAVITDWPVVIHAFLKERSVVWGNATLGDLSRHEMRLYTRRLP